MYWLIDKHSVATLNSCYEFKIYSKTCSTTTYAIHVNDEDVFHIGTMLGWSDVTFCQSYLKHEITRDTKSIWYYYYYPDSSQQRFF